MSILAQRFMELRGKETFAAALSMAGQAAGLPDTWIDCYLIEEMKLYQEKHDRTAYSAHNWTIDWFVVQNSDVQCVVLNSAYNFYKEDCLT